MGVARRQNIVRIVIMPNRDHPLSNQSVKVKESTRMSKTFRASREVTILCLLFAFVLSSTPARGQRRQSEDPVQPASKDSDLLKPLQWRSIGPYRGGRVTAVAGVASQ